MSRISSKNQVTIPVDVLKSAGFAAGDDLVVVADSRDRIVLQRRVTDVRGLAGQFDGVYPADYLTNLRAGERF
jgi:bifunctional DNA-binding transcriptional regulator/antitoxin component of YhaV-PrlF toxin-antitoxin module